MTDSKRTAVNDVRQRVATCGRRRVVRTVAGDEGLTWKSPGLTDT